VHLETDRLRLSVIAQEEVGRIATLAATIALAAATLTGCATTVCADFGYYETPEQLAKASTLVLTGRVVERVGTSRMFHESAPVYRIAVDTVVTGEYSKATIDVVSTPETCGGNTSGNTSPNKNDLQLETTATIELFLGRNTLDDGSKAWTTVTPYQGVLPIPASGELPYPGN
jgi:hypothetical protein